MSFKSKAKAAQTEKRDTELERVGHITLDYVPKDGDKNTPVFRGRAFLDEDDSWVQLACWKSDREGSKLDYNGTMRLSSSGDTVGYINLIKATGKKYVMHGWLTDGDEDSPTQYKIFLYARTVRGRDGKEVQTYDLEGSVFKEVDATTEPQSASVSSIVPDDDDYIPF